MVNWSPASREDLSFPLLGDCAWVLTQSCLTLCDWMDCSSPGSYVHGFFQARILEWVAIFSSRGIFLIQGLNPHLLCLLHWQAHSSTLSHLGSPKWIRVTKTATSFAGPECTENVVPFVQISLRITKCQQRSRKTSTWPLLSGQPFTEVWTLWLDPGLLLPLSAVLEKLMQTNEIDVFQLQLN